jgi:sigma-B regulation protein RsbU (phosphoserine phosphatase)
MLPARNVGGDFYDCFPLSGSRLGLVVGDVSGKGVPAAIFMAISRSLFRTVAARGETPGECLQEANTLLCQDNRSGLFVTLFYAILDAERGELAYSSAGHNPALLLSAAGGMQRLEPGPGETVLGVIEDVRYRTGRASFAPGDALFIYTDGVTEARDGAGNLFGPARLEAVLRHGAPTAEGLVRAVVDAVREFAAGAPQSDDVTALAVRRPEARRADW